MEKRIASVGQADQLVIEQVNGAAALVVSEEVSSIARRAQFRYTLPHFNLNWRGKLMQTIVDKLHQRGD